VTERFGIPVMTVERTLVALAETESRFQLESALKAALRSASLRLDALDLVLQHEIGRRGSGRLRALANEVAPVDPKSRSSLEDQFMSACLRAGLPRPRVNALIEGLEVDLLWNRERLVIELDGFEYHRDRLAFERDRERDAHLARAGYRVIRFTFRAVEDRLEECISTVRELLDGA
jgi:very-short-patch-repair endonuclease